MHLFDLWRYVLESEVEEVLALARHGVRDDENASVSASMANGVLASAQLSERTAHNIQIEVCGSEGRLLVACQRFDGFEVYARQETSGDLNPRLRAMQRFLQELPRGLARRRRLGDYGDSYKGAWRHLLDAIRTLQPVECTLADGREALRVALAAAASASADAPFASQKRHRFSLHLADQWSDVRLNDSNPDRFAVILATRNRPQDAERAVGSILASPARSN